MTPFSKRQPEASLTRPQAAAERTLRRAFAGLEAIPDGSGALWLPELSALLVADLHLEKGSSFARRGLMLPPYDTRATLAALEEVVSRLAPRLIICLGDSFHDGAAGERLAAEDRACIARLGAGREIIWISGNHDPEPVAGLPGRQVAELTLGTLVLRHIPSPVLASGSHEIAGHYHPVAAIHRRGRRLRARCFVHDDRRMILPAFGAYTGGLNVLEPEIAGLFAAQFTACMIGTAAVHAIPSRLLRR